MDTKVKKPRKKRAKIVVERTNVAPCAKCKKEGCEIHLASVLAPILKDMPPLRRAALREIIKKMEEVRVTRPMMDAIRSGRLGDISIKVSEPTKFEKLTKKELKHLGYEEPTEEDLLEPKHDPFAGASTSEEADAVVEPWVLPDTVKVVVRQGNAGGIQNGICFTGGTIKYSGYETPLPKEVSTSDVKWLTKIGLEKVDRTASGCYGGDPHESKGGLAEVAIYRPKDNPKRMSIALKLAQMLAPALRRRLETALEASTKGGKDRGMKMGKVDAGRITKLITEKKSDVFYKKGKTVDINSAVSIVIDDSSSMSERSGDTSLSVLGEGRPEADLLHSKSGASMVLALTLGIVLDQLDISFEILSYQANTSFCSGRWAILYKTFTENWASTMNRIGNYRTEAGVDVPLEAMRFGLTRLSSRPEKRRVLFFLSDASSYNDKVDKLYELACEADRRLKIKTVGIGILAGEMKRYMKDRAETVMSLRDLTDTLFGRLAKIIHPPK